MAIDKPLGTENNPDVRETGSAVEVMPEESRSDQIKNAAEILVSEQGILVDGEIGMEAEMPSMDFNSNLVDFINPIVLQKLASDLITPPRVLEAPASFAFFIISCARSISPIWFQPISAIISVIILILLFLNLFF